VEACIIKHGRQFAETLTDINFAKDTFTCGPLSACDDYTFVDQFVGTQTARLSALFSGDGFGESNCVDAKWRAFDLAFGDLRGCDAASACSIRRRIASGQDREPSI
jgi:hypothetical protein